MALSILPIYARSLRAPSQEQLQAMTAEEKNRYFPIPYQKVTSSHETAILGYIQNYQAAKSTLAPADILDNANKVAKYWDIDIDYLICIMRKESSFCQRATKAEVIYGRNYLSYGVCQIIGYDHTGKHPYGALDAYLFHGGDGHYKWSDITSFSEPNMYIACFYLRFLWKNHSNLVTVDKLLGAYNAGPSGCDKPAAVRYATTVQNYVTELKSLYK